MGCIANANAQESKDNETVQDVYPYNTFDKWRIGGYSELVAAFKDYGSNRFFGHSNGNVKENRSTIAIPRATIAGDYKFNSKWILGLEVEFEAGGVGTAYELENTENGEYDSNKTLSYLEMQLNPDRFIRISRFEIVNIRKIARFDFSVAGTVHIVFDNGNVTWAARRYVRAIQEALNRAETREEE